jgi:hypothetical protein
VGNWPTVLAFCGGDPEVVVEYQGVLKAAPVRDFLLGLRDVRACRDAAKKTQRSPPRESESIHQRGGGGTSAELMMGVAHRCLAGRLGS